MPPHEREIYERTAKHEIRLDGLERRVDDLEQSFEKASESQQKKWFTFEMIKVKWSSLCLGFLIAGTVMGGKIDENRAIAFLRKLLGIEP
ncbi:hypothetical protein J8F10_24030 [Gemmata sp. G18]|uniref:Uncharacterized protein n=1 Tax=Gemmata palustris TaxID=2822762 RepID=A0ABS5BX63_9BACT|nr:hypothetical protein [Gemmata palustris]MBP3958329.1 hypothetical protein [Gemmata palustris]